MKYPLPTEPIPQSARKQINEKLLYLIDNDTCAAYDVSKADVFQAYTGRGGLHGLQRSDYNSYAAYSEAKKEAENGQVFTPARLCQFVVDCLHIGQDDLIADLTCGMGTFFNFLPNERNAYGCELDIDAYKVAAFLFPQAHLENKDVRRYTPGVQFDYILGNPPYNLRWWVEEGKNCLSQFYYCIKAAELLKPLGILAIIVPASFLNDSFSDGAMISAMENAFSFLGQAALPENAFQDIGIVFFNAEAEKQMLRELKSRHLEFHLICGGQAHAYFSENHPLACQQDVSMEELSSYPFISYDRKSGVNNVYTDVVLFSQYRKVVTVGDRATAQAMMQGSNAFTIGSGFRSLLDPSQVLCKPIRDGNQIKIGWLSSERVILSDNAKRYVDLLQQEIYSGR